VDKTLKAFFWAGKKRLIGGKCLVAWDAISKPTRYGGLGVKNLKLQGLALRARWEWLRRTDPTRPWQGLQMTSDQASGLFQTFAKAIVGDGKTDLFWKDRWIHGRTETS
jgi:hypothetical protein